MEEICTVPLNRKNASFSSYTRVPENATTHTVEQETFIQRGRRMSFLKKGNTCCRTPLIHKFP